MSFQLMRRRFGPRGLMARAVIGLGLSMSAPHTAEACSNSALISKAGASFLSAARARSASAFSSALNRYVDIGSVAALALGKHRKRASAAQRKQITRLTGGYIARNLAQFSGKFKARSLKIVRCKGSTVETRLVRLNGGVPQRLLWRVSRGKITDVNVQNIWLGQLLKSNYHSIIRRGGGDVNALIAKLGGSRVRTAKNGTSK